MGFYIKENDYQKIIDFANEAYNQHKSEIGGMCIMKLDDDKDWVLHEPKILEQEVSSGNCYLDKVDLANYYVTCAKKHGNDIRFVWWHSHAKMSAFWSGTDTNTMKEYKGGDWSASLVVNCKGEYKFRVCVWDPIVTHEDVDLGRITKKKKERKIPKSIVNLVTNLTKLKSYSSTYNSGSNGYYRNWVKDHKSTEISSVEELDSWNASFNNYESIESESLAVEDINCAKYGDQVFDLAEAWDLLKSLNEEYIEGLISYKTWGDSVGKLNTYLSEEKDLNVNRVRVRTFTQSELDGLVFTVDSAIPYKWFRNLNQTNLPLNMEEPNGQSDVVSILGYSG